MTFIYAKRILAKRYCERVLAHILEGRTLARRDSLRQRKVPRMDTPVRVLVTKIGLDGHDRGSRIIAAYLRDAGHEVVYTPPWQTLEAVVRLAVQEDIEVIGISSLATDHLIVPDIIQELVSAGLDDVAVVVGGIVPDSEHAALTDAGVARIFGPGSSRDDIVNAVSDLGAQVQQRRRQTEVSA